MTNFLRGRIGRRIAVIFCALVLLLVGGGAGQLQGGRHLQYARDTPMTNLLVSQLDKAGVRLDDGLGDSTGRLVALSALVDI